jgi:hypothetical protein
LSSTQQAGFPAARRGKRDNPKLIRYSAAELSIVAQRARDSGRPVARFIREASLGAAPRARRTAVSDVIIRQLARVANHLTELSRVATEANLARAEEFEKAVGEVLEIIRVIE